MKYNPQVLKMSYIIMIPMPVKNLTKPKSYRLFALLPVTPKLFEKLILNGFKQLVQMCLLIITNNYQTNKFTR